MFPLHPEYPYLLFQQYTQQLPERLRHPHFLYKDPLIHCPPILKPDREILDLQLLCYYGGKHTCRNICQVRSYLPLHLLRGDRLHHNIQLKADRGGQYHGYCVSAR